MKYRFVQENLEYPVTRWAALLKFSTSGYYDWLKTKDEWDRKQKDYKKSITKILNDSGETYGRDRVCGLLRRQGYTASYQRVSVIMKRLGLSSLHNRRRQRSLTDSRKARGKEWPNLVNELEFFKPFEVITSDISCIRTSEGFEYLCRVKDVATGIVLAHTMKDNMKTELMTEAIKKAKKRWNLPEGCIHHNDLGSQYTAKATQELLNDLGFHRVFPEPVNQVTMPGVKASSPFSKKKLRTGGTSKHVKKPVKRCSHIIEGFYNTRRVQKRLGYLSPIEWLNHYTEEL